METFDLAILIELVLDEPAQFLVSLTLTTTLCVPIAKEEALYFATPLESVVTVTVLYFFPVYTFKANLTFGTVCLVFELITFTWKYLPDAYVVASLDGLMVTGALEITILFSHVEFEVTFFETTLAVAE